MTIKKRLFISNILMTVIPFFVSSVAVFVINAIFDGALVRNIRTERELQEYHRTFLGLRMVVGPLFAMVFFIAILYLTNRLLTKFVFVKIKEPLESLSSGVSQISDGNLDYRITYSENDEFTPVCEDFNNMAVRLKTSIDEVLKNEENRKELLASISHDLLSPLTSIKGFVEGLIDGIADTPEKQREYLQIIRQKTDDINNMVSQLFFYSKMDMGNYPTHPEILNIADELADFVSASKDEYRAKGLAIGLKHMPDNGYIYADSVQLRSIFANILNNSAKYKEKDTANATIECTVAGGIVRIVFEDDGPGVPKTDLPKLFYAFYRSDPSRNSPHEGSGLGLAIAAKALERMNGNINATNIKGVGLRLTVEIPSVKGDSDEESFNNRR